MTSELDFYIEHFYACSAPEQAFLLSLIPELEDIRLILL